jgi:hypothetical protein
LSGITGELVADTTYGTAILETHQTKVGPETIAWPVKWPSGYTGRRGGSQVEVLDGTGHVVARTGTRVQISGGYAGENPRVWSVCGLRPLDGSNPNVQTVP